MLRCIQGTVKTVKTEQQTALSWSGFETGRRDNSGTSLFAVSCWACFDGAETPNYI
jgi:hypothetical protein